MENSTPIAAIDGNLRLWLPTMLWMITLFVLSTSFFSAANTSKVILPVLRFLLPGASGATIELLHGIIRKAAHFTNYCILFWILIHGPLARRPYTALAICVCYAF
ncbi:MAG: VanZ family protein, partial [Deltaproteobacteria bacterium]|nr:VanZ family protein [Deltaproteobacteria bacterium]